MVWKIEYASVTAIVGVFFVNRQELKDLVEGADSIRSARRADTARLSD